MVISAVGAATLALAGWPIVKARRARGWPKVKATVLKTKVIPTSGDSERPAGSRFEISYRYGVGDSTYTSDRLSYFHASSRNRYRGAAEKLRKRFTEGSTIRVHYDPSDPAQSTIDTAVPWGYYFAAGLGLIFFVTGTVMLLVLSVRSSS
jgi:hypothetical protein